MTRERADIEASLLRKGFRKDDGDHHYFIYYNLFGKKTAKKTKTSHGSSYKTIGDPLLGQMAKQIGVTKPSFLELVDCTLDQPGYENIAFPSPPTPPPTAAPAPTRTTTKKRR